MAHGTSWLSHFQRKEGLTPPGPQQMALWHTWWVAGGLKKLLRLLTIITMSDHHSLCNIGQCKTEATCIMCWSSSNYRWACSISDPDSDTVIVTGGHYTRYKSCIPVLADIIKILLLPNNQVELILQICHCRHSQHFILTTVSRYGKEGWREDFSSGLKTGRYGHGCSSYLSKNNERVKQAWLALVSSSNGLKWPLIFNFLSWSLNTPELKLKPPRTIPDWY